MITIEPLGAGQDIGKSCILISINNKYLMLDCGVHMGFNDNRIFPDFNLIKNNIEFICISHFHLDHIAALPYYTEIIGYNGPIFMTYPTKAMSNLILQDYINIQKVNLDKSLLYSTENINNCLNKVIPLNIKQTFNYHGFQITPYNAGHIIGACMFHIKYGKESIFYTGDFSMTADRHLSPASAPMLHPTVFISESTYGNTVRPSRLDREREFVSIIYKTLKRDGKVLVPVFALGRCQELCLLLDAYWNSLNLNYPIYISGFLGKNANFYYNQYISWCNETIQHTFYNKPYFNSKRILNFERQYMYDNKPKVVFASPGMLHSGLSLEIFQNWCNDSKNTVIIPGFCVKGTIGNQLIQGQRKIKINKRSYRVNCEIKYLSFSAHADANGIVKLCNQLNPKNILFVHGSNPQINEAKKLFESIMPDKLCYIPNTGESISIQ